MNRIAARALGVSLLVPVFVAAQGQPQGGPPRQSEGDAYTRYELLAPGSAKFRIIYEVTATTSGANYYFNPIRKGSVATDESVIDRASGKPLVGVIARVPLISATRAQTSAKQIALRLAAELLTDA